MRLDLFLKASRLVKRRTVAKEACENQRISLNGRPAKAGARVTEGDTITLDYGRRLVTVRVSRVPVGSVPKAASADLYELLSEETKDPGSPRIPEPWEN